MNPFRYVTARTPDDAIGLVGEKGRYLAGGIDLLGEMKDYIVSPDVLVNVKGIRQPDDLGAIQKIDGATPAASGFRLGATVTVADIAANDALKQALPGLCEAAGEIGSPQIRNVASLAGNLLQHSRCWYYRQPDIVCLKRGGTTCYAKEGENKYLSLFSGCDCLSPVTSNLAVILSALDVRVEVKSGGKSRHLTMAELYHEAWKNPHAHNSLQPRDFLLGVHVPLTRARSAYRQQSEKGEFDWALVSCAAAGNVKDGRISQARLVLGVVAPVPRMVAEVNDFLEGQPLNDTTASKAADLLLKGAKPLAQNGYKVPLAHALIRRTLLALNT